MVLPKDYFSAKVKFHSIANANSVIKYLFKKERLSAKMERFEC